MKKNILFLFFLLQSLCNKIFVNSLQKFSFKNFPMLKIRNSE